MFECLLTKKLLAEQDNRQKLLPQTCFLDASLCMYCMPLSQYAGNFLSSSSIILEAPQCHLLFLETSEGFVYFILWKFPHKIQRYGQKQSGIQPTRFGTCTNLEHSTRDHHLFSLEWRCGVGSSSWIIEHTIIQDPQCIQRMDFPKICCHNIFWLYNDENKLFYSIRLKERQTIVFFYYSSFICLIIWKYMAELSVVHLSEVITLYFGNWL